MEVLAVPKVTSKGQVTIAHLKGKKTDDIIDELRGEADDFGR